MNFVLRPAGHLASRQSRSCLRCPLIHYSRLLASLPRARARWIQHSSRLAECLQGNGEAVSSVTDAAFWKEYKASFAAPQRRAFTIKPRMPRDKLGKEGMVLGSLTKIKSMSETLCFASVDFGMMNTEIQVACHGSELCQQLRSIRLNSSVRVVGKLALKPAPKTAPGNIGRQEPLEDLLELSHKQVEVVATEILCLNSVAPDVHISKDHSFTPQSRHLQIRFDESLKRRLLLRSRVARYIKEYLGKEFLEVETPILFKSSPEGAREFLVPTRKPGYAYALPQSPQQYKQILMATGVKKYFQFAKCFRDEDLRVDRQPEFTQLDLEMAYADGETVMAEIEYLIKSLYLKVSSNHPEILETPLPESAFVRMSYEEAMSKHGSDKPDLRIGGLIQRIDDFVPDGLRSMLTSVQEPAIEACKLRLNCESQQVRTFLTKFMDSPDAETFTSNVDGAPGFCVYDSRSPVEGLQTLGFEGAEQLKTLYRNIRCPRYQNEEVHKANTCFEDGDLLIIQARQNLPHSGGSTILGKLRLALHKAAVAEGLIQPDTDHHYLWITEFPMFTLDNDTDPGQGGTAGFSATHHPFTAPRTAEDVDLLLTDPLKAKADHYDLVVNGVELGGGSRRIHNAEMQKFVMRDIIKMSEERMNDFSHLFEALASGCPPHAGFAIGFDRLMAVLTGVESVKDVIYFPKSSKGEDMMVKSPAPITNAALSPYHLQLKSPIEP